MRRLIKHGAIAFSSIFSIISLTNAYATSYQIFPNIAFSNPAATNSIHEGEFIIGGLGLSNRFHFTGTALGVNGSTSSNTHDFLPYGRIAMRLSPKIVASFDITQPYFTDIQYPRNSLVALFATETFIRDYNYSPKVSYQVNPRLALGLGFDANNLYNGQLNFALSPFGEMTNKAESWAYGWDVGLFYVLTPATFINFSYYSQMIQHAEGKSNWGPITTNNLNASVKLPATAILNGIQMLSPAWALSATIRYTNWSILRYTVLQNTAIGPITVPDHFFNNISAQLATHYQINNQWAVLAAIDDEPNVQPTYTRSVGLPTYTRYTPAIGAEYTLTKGLKAKLIYGHVFSNPPINFTLTPGATIQGHDRLNVDLLDFSMTYDI